MFLVLKHNSLLTYTNFCIKRVFFLRKQKNMLTKKIYSFPCASNKITMFCCLIVLAFVAMKKCISMCISKHTNIYHSFLAFLDWINPHGLMVIYIIQNSKMSNIKDFFYINYLFHKKSCFCTNRYYYNVALKVHISLGIYFKIVLSFLSFKMQKSLL